MAEQLETPTLVWVKGLNAELEGSRQFSDVPARDVECPRDYSQTVQSPQTQAHKEHKHSYTQHCCQTGEVFDRENIYCSVDHQASKDDHQKNAEEVPFRAGKGITIVLKPVEIGGGGVSIGKSNALLLQEIAQRFGSTHSPEGERPEKREKKCQA